MRKKTLKLRSGLKLTEFELFNRMVAWLEHHFIGAGYLANVQRLLSKMFRIRETRGNTQAVLFVKKTRLGLLKALEGLSQQQLLSSDRNGVWFPKDLRFLKKAKAESVYPLLRLSLSVLAIFRFLRGDGTPSFSSIEHGPTFGRLPDSFEEEKVPFLRSLGLNPRFLGTRPRKLNFRKFSMTTKSGPKGHALWTSYLDLLHLPDSLKESIGFVGGKRLQEDMSNYLVFIPYIRDYFQRHLAEARLTLRRLSIIRDKEGKNREIAILDYYSQQALRPLHNVLFKLIATIPQDCTFDHGKALHILKPSPGSSYHSIDLSNATDRFPIEIQRSLLETLYGKEYSNHWKNIMVGFPFDYQGRSINYIRGNPMGAYSSWSAFVLAHHFLIYCACKEAHVKWKKCPYLLLGDDIVIANDKVAESYIRILQRFEIPFSQEKSHRSPYMFEFAKRFIHEGTEITPFPLAGLFENRNNWLLAVGTIIEETYRKRWIPRIDILQSSIGFLKVLGYNSRYITRHALKLELIIWFREAFAGLRPLAHALQRAAYLRYGEALSNQVVNMGLLSAQMILLPALADVFGDSVSRLVDSKNRKPLGLIAEDLTIVATSLFERVEDPFLLIRSCPILQVYGQVEELYLSLHREPLNIGAIVEEDFKSVFRSVAIPTGDESFYMRRKDVLLMATSRLIDGILVQLDDMMKFFSYVPPKALRR